MRIINTLPQVRELFAYGHFDMARWRVYAAEIMPELPEICEKDAAEYDFACEVLPVIEAALQDGAAMNTLAASFAAVSGVLRQNMAALYTEEPDVDIILYLGLCNAAGWAWRRSDHPQGRQAILLGIEKIIELRWYGETDMKGLVFHELGHLWHETEGREELPEVSLTERAVTQLYDEGIAMRCEQLLCGDAGFFHQDQDGWLNRCRAHAGEMRADYLRRLETGESTQCFFGDWVRWKGISDAGYFLGCEFVAAREKAYSLKRIACMSYAEIELALRAYLSGE